MTEKESRREVNHKLVWGAKYLEGPTSLSSSQRLDSDFPHNEREEKVRDRKISSKKKKGGEASLREELEG